MSHKLSLSIQDSIADDKFIMVNDLSVYDQVIGATQRTLQVLTPYDSCYKLLAFPESSYMAFSSIDLGLSEKELTAVPDGMYRFHYSVAPNSKVFITVSHYRVACLMNQVYAGMLATADNCCQYVDECGNMIIDKQRNTLLNIWMSLKGIQGAGNVYFAERADAIYKQAQRALDRLNQTCKM